MEPPAGRPLTLEDSATVTAYSLETALNRVILGDALQVLSKLPDSCADLVFLDPPYFLQLPAKRQLKRWHVKTAVTGVDDAWDKFSSTGDYLAFLQALLAQLKRLMKPSATLWAISTYHSVFRIGAALQDLGFWILNDVIWVKTNPMPNWLGVRFTNATETLIWAVRDQRARGHTFNRAAAKEFGLGKVGANVWVLPLCTGGERLKGADGRKLHSTQKPAELLRRVLLTSSKEGDLVLDPLAGTGTTGAVAKELQRNFILVERNPAYVAGAVKRLGG